VGEGELAFPLPISLSRECAPTSCRGRGEEDEKIGVAGSSEVFVLAGCGGYWMVTDPTSKNVYYTEKLKQSKEGGAVKFTDAKTGTQVNPQNSEIKEVTEDEFKAAVGKKQHF
jgi:hypothetical protein